MRQYLIHRKYYLAYLQAQRTVERILDEREVLMQKVLPRSPLAEHERDFMPSAVVGGSTPTKKAEEYAIQMEQRKIRERLAEAEEILVSRKLLLTQVEEDLRKSKDIYNMVYTAKWVDKKKVSLITDETGYSKSQVYAIIGHLTAQLDRTFVCSEDEL